MRLDSCVKARPPEGVGLCPSLCPTGRAVGARAAICAASPVLHGDRCAQQPDGHRGLAASASRRTGQAGSGVGRGAGVGGRAAWGHAAPHPALVATLHCRSNGLLLPGCVRPGTGGGRVLLPLTASHGSGEHGGGRPLAAARGCRLLRRFFFLLKTRNVILAGPRQGQASLRSVRTRTLDMALSARIGDSAGRRKKKKNAAATGRFAARGRTACFTPRRHGKIWRSGGAQAPAGVPLQHTALRKTPWMKTVEVLKT